MIVGPDSPVDNARRGKTAALLPRSAPDHAHREVWFAVILARQGGEMAMPAASSCHAANPLI